MTTQMLKYIKSNIDNNYAMEVLYYSIRKAIADNDFTFKVTTSIKISNKFLEPSVDININHKFSKQIEAFSLLLSVRALMLDKTLIKYCHGDMLLFEDYPMHKFGWIAYTTMIMDCMNDEEFSDIYYLLEEVYSGNKLSNDDKEFFVNSTTVPEYKNLPNYYKKFAKDKKGVTSEVICNNAFVCEDELIEYVVTENVAYIGNTAFSYCKNLTTITFERKDLLFGKFPIVECDSLRRIMVPIGCEEYYKNALPFYKDIIFSEETLNNLETKTDEYEELEIEYMFFNPKTGEYVPESELKNQEEVRETSRLHITPPINPTKLKEIFNKEVTSYKYFWFLSIITLIKEKEELTISFQDLVIRMVAQAWQVIFRDKYDLGATDMMSNYLSVLKDYTSLAQNSTLSDVENWLHNNFSSSVKKILDPLLNNVPYSLLAPWINYDSNDDIIEKSNSTDYAALYAIHKDVIIMDEDWFDYIIENYDDVYKFATESLANYLKPYNNESEYIKYRMQNVQAEDLLYLLLEDNTTMSIFIALQIAGNDTFRSEYGFEKFTEDYINQSFKRTKDNPMNSLHQVWLKHIVMYDGKCPFSKMSNRNISSVSFSEFRTFYANYKNKNSKTKQTVQKLVGKGKYRTSNGASGIYDNYEYGLSDW
ncbi:MAG: leucine-rich repeat protein [Bacteroidaceae bacterium]|nr:leucine-rich repeat protein [Bacteroidaceae bacterium]